VVSDVMMASKATVARTVGMMPVEAYRRRGEVEASISLSTPQQLHLAVPLRGLPYLLGW
jgi:hypothetical protein